MAQTSVIKPKPKIIEPVPNAVSDEGLTAAHGIDELPPEETPPFIDPETAPDNTKKVKYASESRITKTEGGKQFPAGDYAYVPDHTKPSTWKIRLTSTPGGPPDSGIVGAAAAAVGNGFRGNKAAIPSAHMGAVKAKVRGAWRRANPGKSDDEMPEGIKMSENEILNLNNPIHRTMLTRLAAGESLMDVGYEAKNFVEQYLATSPDTAMAIRLRQHSDLMDAVPGAPPSVGDNNTAEAMQNQAPVNAGAPTMPQPLDELNSGHRAALNSLAKGNSVERAKLAAKMKNGTDLSDDDVHNIAKTYKAKYPNNSISNRLNNHYQLAKSANEPEPMQASQPSGGQVHVPSVNWAVKTQPQMALEGTVATTADNTVEGNATQKEDGAALEGSNNPTEDGATPEGTVSITNDNTGEGHGPGDEIGSKSGNPVSSGAAKSAPDMLPAGSSPVQNPHFTSKLIEELRPHVDPMKFKTAVQKARAYAGGKSRAKAAGELPPGLAAYEAKKKQDDGTAPQAAPKPPSAPPKVGVTKPPTMPAPTPPAAKAPEAAVTPTAPKAPAAPAAKAPATPATPAAPGTPAKAPAPEANPVPNDQWAEWQQAGTPDPNGSTDPVSPAEEATLANANVPPPGSGEADLDPGDDDMFPATAEDPDGDGDVDDPNGLGLPLKYDPLDPRINLRMAEIPGETCGDCANFFNGICQLVSGVIEDDLVCDMFIDCDELTQFDDGDSDDEAGDAVPDQQPAGGMDGSDGEEELSNDGSTQASEQPLNLFDACGKSDTQTCKMFIEHRFAEPKGTMPYLPIPGSYTHPKWGPITITPERNQHFVDNFNQRVYQEHLPIDAEHETKVSGALGWITGLAMNSNGSVDANVNWTDRGRSMIEADRFRYVSPEWYDEWTDPANNRAYKDVAIGAALTTRPFFKDGSLRPLVATENGIYTVEPVVKSKPKTKKLNEQPQVFKPVNGTGNKGGQVTDTNTNTPSAAPGSQAFAELEAKFAAEQTKSEKQAEQLRTLSERIAEMDNDALRRKFTDIVLGRSEGYPNRWFGEPASQVNRLMKLADTFGEDSEDTTSYIKEQCAMAEQLRQNKIFSEMGSNQGGPANGSALAEIAERAKLFNETHPQLTKEQAQVKVLNEDPGLYERYKAEMQEGL